MLNIAGNIINVVRKRKKSLQPKWRRAPHGCRTACWNPPSHTVRHARRGRSRAAQSRPLPSDGPPGAQQSRSGYSCREDPVRGRVSHLCLPLITRLPPRFRMNSTLRCRCAVPSLRDSSIPAPRVLVYRPLTHGRHRNAQSRSHQVFRSTAWKKALADCFKYLNKIGLKRSNRSTAACR